MKVSLNVVKSLINFELPPIHELVARVNAQLGGVEEVIDLGAKYAGARIVRVVKCDKHPDADRLTVCLIDDGGAEDVERNGDGLVQVVCGAPNARENMWAVWLPPKSVVPASFDDDEPFVLSARPLRGVVSQGMLAAGDELSLNDDHEGIIEIHETDLPNGAELVAGAKFADVFGLNDYVLDIENKMFTHRPDCFGQLGVAREIAGIFGHKFESPDWYTLTTEFTSGEGLQLEVFNDAPEKSARFMAVAIKNVKVKPSPLWLQCQLVAMGARAINNIVDATNYIMLLTAQPTHAYDYDKIRGSKIGVRMAQPGESLTLLNGKTYELNEDDIVIADGEGAIGLAGIMGGGNSEVSDSTKNIILECANFDMYALRRSAMKHGVFTDALARFNKGQSPLQNAPVLKQLMSMVGGEQASEVFDTPATENCILTVGSCSTDYITTGKEFINMYLATDFSDADIKNLLENVNFVVEPLDGGLQIFVPFWRMDVELPEDIVEEVGRLYGFDKLPRELPRRSTLPAAKNSRRELKRLIRDSLSRAGANEVLTYSFVHENIFKKAGQNPSQAYKLSNALSPDLQYYRTSVLASLLDKVHANIKSGHDEFTLFEIGKTHDKSLPLGDDNLPRERTFVDGVYASKKSHRGAPFYQARRLVEHLLGDLNVAYEFTAMAKSDESSENLSTDIDSQIVAPFDWQRTARLIDANGEPFGVIGELKQSVRRNFKLPDYTAAFSIDIDKLQKLVSSNSNYCPLSRFPSTSRDVSLKVSANLPYDKLISVIKSTIQEIKQNNPSLMIDYQPKSIYQSADGAAAKTITVHLRFTNYEKTLTDEEISPLMAKILLAAGSELSAEEA